MDEAKAKQIVDYTFKDVFGVACPFSLEAVKERFAFDVKLPMKMKGAITGEEVWAAYDIKDTVIGQQAFIAQVRKDDWVKKKGQLNSIDDMLTSWREINYLRGERNINSVDITKSDCIYNSSSVYQCYEMIHAQENVFSYNSLDCKYLVASSNNSMCTLGVRMDESVRCSSSFEVSFSDKVSRSMYIHDSVDLYECIFCAHLRSKKYCIANMQFEKEEYLKMKNIVIKWTLENFDAKLKAELNLGK